MLTPKFTVPVKYDWGREGDRKKKKMELVTRLTPKLLIEHSTPLVLTLH